VSKERRLGRGLAALLGSPLVEEPAVLPISTPVHDAPQARLPGFERQEALSPPPTDDFHQPEAANQLLQLDVHAVQDNPFQPRREFSETEIASLAESLKQHDMLQPILVRKVGPGYQLISGERRLRAAIRAGWTTIPARVREADDRLVAELAIVENLQRKDLNPIEKALSFKRYLDEHRCTQEELANRLAIDRSTIANLLRLLELPEPILAGVRTGQVTAGHARALLPLGDDREQLTLAKRIESDGLSVRDVERIVGEKLASDEPGPRSTKAKRTRSEQTAALEQEFRLALGVKAEIQQAKNGRGKIVLSFANHEEFDRIRDALTASLGPSRRAA
jgi:ParB family chromosome partitioning protein